MRRPAARLLGACWKGRTAAVLPAHLGMATWSSEARFCYHQHPSCMCASFLRYNAISSLLRHAWSYRGKQTITCAAPARDRPREGVQTERVSSEEVHNPGYLPFFRIADSVHLCQCSGHSAKAGHFPSVQLNAARQAAKASMESSGLPKSSCYAMSMF